MILCDVGLGHGDARDLYLKMSQNLTDMIKPDHCLHFSDKTKEQHELLLQGTAIKRTGRKLTLSQAGSEPSGDTIQVSLMADLQEKQEEDVEKVMDQILDMVSRIRYQKVSSNIAKTFPEELQQEVKSLVECIRMNKTPLQSFCFF